MKTSTLTGRALDYAVAKSMGYNPEVRPGVINPERLRLTWANPVPGMPCPRFSIDWAQTGPIIQREGIGLKHYRDDTWSALCEGVPNSPPFHQRGPTPLIAAMRCFVASKLGDEVDIPKELE